MELEPCAQITLVRFPILLVRAVLVRRVPFQLKQFVFLPVAHTKVTLQRAAMIHVRFPILLAHVVLVRRVPFHPS